MFTPSANIKVQPEDWRVTEIFDPECSGSGEHVYLQMEKRKLGTNDVASWLSRHFRVPLVDIGFAGMKDKHAVTVQWFSVRLPSSAKPASAPVSLDSVAMEESCGVYAKAIAIRQHEKKLRRGEHQGNRFQIRLSGLADADLSAIDQTSFCLAYPNYFGPQRFGRGNIDEALDWLKHRRARKISKRVKGWHLSVLRSMLFNKVLDARVADGTWCQQLPGDVALPSSPSFGSGSLWGRGRSALTDAALACEQSALQDQAWICEALEYAGVDRGLRPLATVPQGVSCQIPQEPGEFELEFSLSVGAYATVMLARYFKILDVSV